MQADTLFHNLITAPEKSLCWETLSSRGWWQAMAACPQDAIHHAEGDVATHTRMVVEALQADDDWRVLPQEEKAILLLAALLHDIAKPETTRMEEDGRITARGHSGRGEVTTRRLLWEAGIAFWMREQVCALIRFHQHPFWLIDRDDARYQAYRISQSARADLLTILARADARGRVCADQDAMLLNVALFREFCAEQNCLTSPHPFPSDHSRFLYFRSEGERDPDYRAHEETGQPELVLLCGLPGVGKDTWVRRHLSDWHVVSLDGIRAEIGVDPRDSQEPVLAVARERTRALLREGKSLIWNATNLSREMRGKRLRFADDYRARVRIVYVETPVAVQRRQNRGREGCVPDAAMERLFRQWEVPDLTEAHTLTWEVQGA